MASTFKSITSLNVAAADTLIYTVPASTTAIVLGLNLANTSGAQITANVTSLDSSAAQTVSIGKTLPIPNGSSLLAIGAPNRLVLETGDTIRVQPSSGAAMDVHLSILEIT